MNDFLELDSWFDQEFKERSGSRYPTFRVALNLLYQNASNPFIVETGTVRMADDWGAGYSTFIFGRFLKTLGRGEIVTIDISQDNIKVCQSVTESFKEHIRYVVDDSLEALKRIDKPIDLLYLDSLDTPIGDSEDAVPAQEHNLKEFKLVEHLLHDKSIVLIDDNAFANGGKAKLTKKYLKEKGWRVLLNGHQSLWIK